MLNVSYGRGRGTPGRGRGRGRGRGVIDKSTIECFKCHKLGHFKNECPMWEAEANYADMENEVMLLMAHTEEEEDEAIGDAEMTLMALMGGQENIRRKAWFLDSGCSNHMSGDKELFSSFEAKFSHPVKLGNNKRMEVTGKGNVLLMLNGESYMISEVYYVPELKNNLLSIGQLQEKRLTILIQKNICKILHEEKGLIVETKMSLNRMFLLIDETSDAVRARNQQCLKIATEEDMPKLWHERFGHLSHRGMRTLQSKGMVRDLPAFDTQKFT